MRVFSALCLFFLVLLPLPALAEIDILCLGSELAAPKAPLVPIVPSPSSLLSKVDRTTSALILPFFEVDTTDVGGKTTVFAVRNAGLSAININIEYFDVFGSTVGVVPMFLPSKDTVTVNMRSFISSFPTDADGFIRGFGLIVAVGGIEGGSTGNPESTPGAVEIGGDYFQIDPDNNFASGDRLLSFQNSSLYFDFCRFTETRFLNGGAFTGGSNFTLITLDYDGTSVSSMPTIYAVVFDEDGGRDATCEIFTDQNILQLTASDLTDIPFGTVEFEFSFGGQVLTEFDALNKFSVGMRGLCAGSSLVLTP